MADNVSEQPDKIRTDDEIADGIIDFYTQAIQDGTALSCALGNKMFRPEQIIEEVRNRTEFGRTLIGAIRTADEACRSVRKD